jgi:hypothetical protein
MLNDTENYYSRNLQSIKVVKGKLSSTASAGLSMSGLGDKKNGLQ